MNIRLTPEQTQLIEKVIDSGQFGSIQEVIDEALRSLRDQRLAPAIGAGNGSHVEGVRQMLEFVEENRTQLDGISIKELIHEGHRL